METPLTSESNALQTRRGKRHRIDLASPQFEDQLKRAIDLIANDQSLPPHLKAAMGYLFEIRNEMNEVLARNAQLLEENRLVKEKNCMLQSEIDSLKSQINVLKKSLSDDPPQSKEGPNESSSLAFEEIERRRSVVIAGVSECDSNVSSVRVSYDIACVRRINDFLSIDSHPVSVYRMGKYMAGRPRLLKVVFPSSFFSSLLLRRAPRLRFFPEKGIFIRPSLPLSERKRFKVSNGSSVVPSTSPVTLSLSSALSLLIKQKSPDIVGITETWLNPTISLASLIHADLGPYSVMRCDRLTKRGGGLALFIKNVFSPMTVFSESLANAYEILCCDFCISQFVDIATLNGRTLDLVLSNEESLIENLEVCSPIGGSDHASIIFTINAHILKDEAITRRDFGKANYENIVCHLASIDWLGSLNCASTVDAKYELFLGILMDCIERYVPLVEKSLGGSALPPYLANLTQRRERAWHKARMTKNSADEREFERLNRKLEKKLKKFNTSVEKK
ncbi:hypothetical protein COOONC_17290, partial [Cooperia oncophora]